MNGSTAFFLVFSGLIALAGLFAAAMAHDYLQFFGFALFVFGVLFGFSCIKRHFDAQDAANH
ncbi:hypothetical protein [Dankookia sp. P2]|uniref:hypothetical protein n=1 Tax=Dankookia sp. P2 TaxID=3423955 RepID=UPI003D67F3B8